MMKMRNSFFFSISLIMATTMLFLTSSCGNKEHGDTVYSHFSDIASNGWDPAEVIAFEPWPLDSINSKYDTYSIDMIFRVSSRHTVGDFPVALTIEDEDGIVSTDTVMIDLSNKNNSENIREQYGVLELRIPVASDFKLNDGYAVSVSPLAERERTRGLLNVGLIMSRKRNL